MSDDANSFRKGVELLKKGYLKEAVRELQVAATTGEDLPIEHFALAVAYEKSGSPVAAIEHYQRFLSMGPTDEGRIAYATRHLARLQARKEPEPLPAPEPLPSVPRTTAASAELAAGETALRDGDPAAALAHLRKAVAVEPSLVDGWIGLGKAAYVAGLKEARSCLENAVTLDPSSARAHFNLGVIAQLQHDLARARAALHTAVDLDPEDAEARAMLDRLPDASG